MFQIKLKDKKRIGSEENGAEEEENEEGAQVEGCCLSALLKTLYTEVSPTSPTTQTNSNSAFSRFEANMIRPDNSFMLMKPGSSVPPNNLSNSSKSNSSLQRPESSFMLSAHNNQQQRKNERMAPFIYEDLPDFYKNQASNSSETCSYLNTSFITPQSSLDFGNKNQNRRSFNGRQSFESRQSNPRSFMNAQNSLETYHMRTFLELPENQYGDVALPMSSVPSRSSTNGSLLRQPDNESNLSTSQMSKKMTSRKNSDRLSVPTAILLSDEFSNSPMVLSDHTQQSSKPVHKKKKNKPEKTNASDEAPTEIKIVKTEPDHETDYTECNL